MKRNPQKITFKQVTSPKGKDFEQLWKIYEECFPIRDEREVKRNILGITKRHPHEDGAKYVESFLLSVNVNGRPAGGAIFDYVEGTAHGRKFSFGIDWYIFIGKEYREHGFGKRLHEEMLASLKEVSRRRGSKLDFVISEMNDLRRMRPQDREKDRKVIIDPEERMEFFSILGYHEIDPSRFRYVQPQLTENKHPCRELMLAIKPLAKHFQSKIPVKYLKQLLWLYTWAGFDGIPGSNFNGHRNPDTDKAYREMKGQLERMRKSLGLKQLVSGPDIRIEPLSKRTLEPAIRLLNSIFSYENEVPDISLRASLNPKPYRKKLDEWKIPELRYWVGLNRSGACLINPLCNIV
jgi:GNAT superfamily N-acetyltransferase